MRLQPCPHCQFVEHSAEYENLSAVPLLVPALTSRPVICPGTNFRTDNERHNYRYKGTRNKEQ